MSEYVVLITKEFWKRDNRNSQEDRRAQKHNQESHNRCGQGNEESGNCRRRVIQHPVLKANGAQRQSCGGNPSRQQAKGNGSRGDRSSFLQQLYNGALKEGRGPKIAVKQA